MRRCWCPQSCRHDPSGPTSTRLGSLSAELRHEAADPVGLGQLSFPVSSRLPARSHSPVRVRASASVATCCASTSFPTSAGSPAGSPDMSGSLLRSASPEVLVPFNACRPRRAAAQQRAISDEPYPASTLAAPTPRFPTSREFQTRPRPCGFSLSKADRCSPACGDGEMLPVRVGLSPVTGPTAFAVAQASGRQRHRQRRARLLARSADLSLNARLHQSPSSSIAGHAPAVLFTRRSATRCHGQRGLAD